MPNDFEALGTMLRNARASAGLSLRAVEARVGVSNAYVSQLEGAKIKQPSPQILHKLCELYGADYQAALEFAGYPVPNSRSLPPNGRFAARLGPTTRHEQDALMDYLQFIRTRKR